jgi:hypothetical protein
MDSMDGFTIEGLKGKTLTAQPVERPAARAITAQLVEALVESIYADRARITRIYLGRAERRAIEEMFRGTMRPNVGGDVEGSALMGVPVYWVDAEEHFHAC